MNHILLRCRETAELMLAHQFSYGRNTRIQASVETSIQGLQVTYLLIVTMSACIGCKAVLFVSLLVGLFAALAGEAFSSAAAALIGDVLPNKDSSTWLLLPTVRYLSAAQT